MQYILRLFVVLSLFFMSFYTVHASFFDMFAGENDSEILYCADGNCGLQEGIDVVKDGLNEIETERSASEYIQDVVVYLMGFVTIIAVLIVVYAGFQILVAQGDDEKLKHSKQTILYVFLGIALMWLAWPIVDFILGILAS